MIGEIGGD